MDLALNNLQRLICHKTQTNKKLSSTVPSPMTYPESHQRTPNSRIQPFSYAPTHVTSCMRLISTYTFNVRLSSYLTSC